MDKKGSNASANFRTLILEKREGIVWIRLNRPEVRNALNTAMFDELKAAIEEVEKDDGVTVVIITGAGQTFCSGKDRREIQLPVDFEFRRMGAFKAIENCSKIVIAAVNGHAITGGFTLALCCDLIVAADNAIFQDNHARLGAMTLRASRMARQIGIAKAKEILFTCRPIPAAEAERIGIINRVVPTEKLEEGTEMLARQIMENHSESLKMIKAVLNRTWNLDLESALNLEELESRAFRERKASRAPEKS